jgi:CRP/FNR family transcriptional regulator, cyclic AMP receptor protein
MTILQLFKRHEPPRRLRELKRMALFAGLSHREVRVVDGFMHERSYLSREVVFDECEQGEAFYVVLEGQVQVCRQGQSDAPLAVLGAGSFFGELALLDDAPRSAQVRAQENCKLLVLFRGDFLGLMESHGLIASKIAIQLARHLASRVRNMNRAEGGPL